MERVHETVQRMDPDKPNSKSLIVDVYKRFVRNHMNKVTHSIIILIVFCVSIYNLSCSKGDNQLWFSLLMLTLGLISPTPTDTVNFKAEI